MKENSAKTDDIQKALRQGDEKAFELLFLTYFSKVKFFIKNILKSDVEAEELAQDIFVKIWINRESIDFGKGMSAFLHTSARNATINYLKKKFTHDNYVNDHLYLNSDDVSESIEEGYYAQETALLIKMAISQMPDRRKEIYELSREKGLRNDEIALRLDISKKTVENQLSLALSEIRKIINSFLILIF